jgi:hypothetical protein
MKKKDSFGIDVIKPVRTEWFPGMDTPDEVWDPEYLGDR